jgi:hypothetical protein
VPSATPVPPAVDHSLTLAERMNAMRRRFRGSHNPAAFVDSVRTRKPWQLREAMAMAAHAASHGVTGDAPSAANGASGVAVADGITPTGPPLVPYYIISTET